MPPARFTRRAKGVAPLEASPAGARLRGAKIARPRADTGGVTRSDPAAGAATPERLAEDALVAADRWSLWRTLARGLGHQLANASQMLALDPLPPGAREETRERLLTAIERLADAHRPATAPPTAIADVIADVAAAQSLQSAYRSTELVLDVARGLPAVAMGGSDLAHVLLALVTNAKQAAGDARASIRVSARPVTDGVAIDVEDDGPGFAAEALAHAGEAFATSSPGERLGLGLHVATRLAARCGGTLEVTGRPARVRLVLPAWTPARRAR